MKEVKFEYSDIQKEYEQIVFYEGYEQSNHHNAKWRKLHFYTVDSVYRYFYGCIKNVLLKNINEEQDEDIESTTEFKEKVRSYIAMFMYLTWKYYVNYGELITSFIGEKYDPLSKIYNSMEEGKKKKERTILYNYGEVEASDIDFVEFINILKELKIVTNTNIDGYGIELCFNTDSNILVKLEKYLRMQNGIFKFEIKQSIKNNPIQLVRREHYEI
jgi:hypothetical protein